MKSRLLLCSLLLLGGCNEIRIGDLSKQFQNTEYVKVISAGNHEIEVRYIPKMLMMIKKSGLKDSDQVSISFLERLAEADSSNGLLFFLTIRPRIDIPKVGFSNDVVYGNIGGFDSYQDALKAFQFGFQDRIWLEVDGVRIPMASYQMENSFGLTPGRTFALSFRNSFKAKSEKKALVTLVLDDLVPGLSRRKIEWPLPV